MRSIKIHLIANFFQFETFRMYFFYSSITSQEICIIFLLHVLYNVLYINIATNYKRINNNISFCTYTR